VLAGYLARKEISKTEQQGFLINVASRSGGGKH